MLLFRRHGDPQQQAQLADAIGIEFAGATVRDMIYPELAAYQFLIYPAAVFLFTLFVSAYPALAAGKLKPAEALRRSL